MKQCSMCGALNSALNLFRLSNGHLIGGRCSEDDNCFLCLDQSVINKGMPYTTFIGNQFKKGKITMEEIVFQLEIGNIKE